MKTSNAKLMILLTYAAAATTVTAGILHIMMAPRSISHNLGGVLFLVGGMLQIFWAVPVIRQWGRVWKIIGITGTAVFVILFFSDRFHILPEGDVFGNM